MRLDELAQHNERALAARPFTRDGYRFTPVTGHDPALHELKGQYPYFGYVEVEVSGVRPFTMLSNNDDVVAQVYFWFGPDAYESLSLRVWRRMSREAEVIADVGAYTGLFTLVAAFAAPEAELHAFEPSPDVFTRLVMNLVVNRLGRRVHLHELAASDETGTAVFHGFQQQLSLSTGSSLVHKEGKELAWSRQVSTQRLDAVLDVGSRTMAVKVDAEEAEHLVVAGLSSLVEESRPRLLVEIAEIDALHHILGTLDGYSFAVLDDERHVAHVDDAGIIELLTRIRRGETTHDRRVLPPNVVLWPGPADELADWLAPLESEPGTISGLAATDDGSDDHAAGTGSRLRGLGIGRRDRRG